MVDDAVDEPDGLPEAVTRHGSLVRPANHNNRVIPILMMMMMVMMMMMMMMMMIVTARVWCRGGIDRKRNSTINLTTDSGACF